MVFRTLQLTPRPIEIVRTTQFKPANNAITRDSTAKWAALEGELLFYIPRVAGAA